MNAVYHDLSALAAAAAACDCSAHIHNDEEGNTVYSIGNSNIGAATFSTYELAMHWAKKRAAGDDAEMAGGNIANALLNDLLTAHTQTRMVILIQAAIVRLATLQHHDSAAAGFAIGLVNTLEIGLQHLPKGASK